MSAGPIAAAEQPGVSPMRLLACGVPLSLLLDLACGPRSDELLREEGCPVPSQRAERD